MKNDRKARLKKLVKENKIKRAKIQLADDLLKHYGINISGKEYADFQISEKVHYEVYEQIKTDETKSMSFSYNEEMLKSKMNFLFDYFRDYGKETILFYPSTFGFYFRSSNQLYLDYPIALKIPLAECKEMVIKLMLDMRDDLIVVSENLKFGFVLSEDEYSYVTIDYWVKNKGASACLSTYRLERF
ncbi:hypothetical protein QNH23_00340 [Siminovitchia fortis]|uniref:hypothetical protein n=1 Tax=Siminovitchia fortis TaxID=254758 RepID=UPI0024C17ECE|nr:hypothetical protein [Siminovitchia fortis]WHY81916.1 hypothetical protein QNH23_00340 [Siminovitchia fortis]